MDNDSGRMNYGVGLDLSALRQDAEKSKEILAEIGVQAVRQGSVIDQAFGSNGAARGFNTLEAAIRGAGTVIKDMDFGTAEEKIGALSFIIKQNENVIADNVRLLDKWKEEAQAAFEAGDTGSLEALTKDIDDQVQKIQELNEETEGYRQTLQAVMSVSGMGSESVSVSRLYNSEEDIKHVEDLRRQILATQSEIARLGMDGGDTTKLTADLSAMKDELNECEKSAAQAAAKLGSDLGGRASEAQQELHSLNSAITNQEKVIAKLSAALEEARTKYETLQQTEGASSEEVEKAAATYDALSESLTNAQEQLAGLQGAQVTAQAQWQSVSNEVQVHDSIMVKMLGGYENYQNIIGQLPQPVQAVIGGIQGMTGAAKAFIASWGNLGCYRSCASSRLFLVKFNGRGTTEICRDKRLCQRCSRSVERDCHHGGESDIQGFQRPKTGCHRPMGSNKDKFCEPPEIGRGNCRRSREHNESRIHS